MKHIEPLPTPAAIYDGERKPILLNGAPGGRLVAARSLTVVTGLVFAYLCLGELLPLQALQRVDWLERSWLKHQIVLLSVLSTLSVMLANFHNAASASRLINHAPSADELLLAINLVPIIAAVGAAIIVLLSQPCVREASDGAVHCDSLGIFLDSVGYISARLARLDLGISLLLVSSHSESGWLFGATGGLLAYPEAVLVHRTAGWWCAGQSMLHSSAYLGYYLHTHSVWTDCFPVALPANEMNRIGLINFFGVCAFLILLVQVLLAIPWLRKGCYHIFVLLHLPLAMGFVLCCALHDLPILLFALPGLAGLYLDKSGTTSRFCRQQLRLPATARLLPGTSGPWVELRIDCQKVPGLSNSTASGGQWASVSVLPLGKEAHPLSVAVYTIRERERALELCAVVSSQAGDWSRALATFSEEQLASSFEVEVAGPFPVGLGNWEWSSADIKGHKHPALLLLAGGTGLNGWLPGLATAARTGRRCRLVWCVRKAEDYHALALRLPPTGAVEVTVFITRATATAKQQPLVSIPCDRQICSGSLPDLWQQSNRFVSLTATIIGLAVCYVLAPAVGFVHYSPAAHSMVEYAWEQRFLPIAFTVAAMVLATALAFHAVSMTVKRPGGGAEDRPLLAPVPAHVSAPLGHDVRSGRPDIKAIVQVAAASVETGCLVVAACGPAELVSAAREASAAAAKHGAVQVDFFGNDPKW